jgi:hypothetical protein
LLLKLGLPSALDFRKLGIDLLPRFAQAAVQFAREAIEHRSHARFALFFHALQGFLLRLL